MSDTDLKYLHHVNVVVTDIEKSLAWYSCVLGLEVAVRVRVDEDELGRGLGVPGADLDAAFLRMPGTEAQVEMVQYIEPGTPEPDPLAPANVPGYGHLAFFVEDIDSSHRALSERGAEFVSPPVRLSDGTRFCFFRDPDGNIVEIIQPG